MPLDSVCVLSHSTALATKVWTVGDGGKAHAQNYGQGKFFDVEVVGLDGLADLHGLLVALQDEPRKFLIRGEIIPGRSLDQVTRTKNSKGGDVPTFREYPRHWMMLDVDGIESGKFDWSTPASCQMNADRVLGLLPIELRRAGHIWQASSSAGMKNGLRFHFWFWLDRPLGEHELERWGEFVNDTAGRKLLDIAVFRTIQPLYVVPPVFGDGVLDPVAQRLGYLPGAPVSLPRMSAKGDGWKRKLEPLYFESNDKIHDHLRNACASYFTANGPDAPDDILVKEIRKAVARAGELQGRQGEYSDDKIAQEVESGRSFAGTRAASGENLLLDNQQNPKSCIGNLIAILRTHEEWQRLLTWDTRSHRIQIIRDTPWRAPPGEWVDSRDSVLAAEWFAQQKRMACDDGMILRAVTTLAREAETDPVADWLEDLEWDGQKRLDQWLIAWAEAADTNYVRRVSRMFLIGAVARALQPGCKLDTVTVFQGKTGRGKSSLVEVLAGRDEWFAAVDDEKDILQKIHGPWFVELPELGPFRSLNYNRIKSFTSTRVDRFRAPYMRLPEDRRRTSVLVATVNPEGIGWQFDATSGRRFWPIDLGEIDLNSISAAREQLFAEAVVAFRAGEQWWVDSADDADFVGPQEAVYAADTWEDIIGRTLIAGQAGFGHGGRTVAIPKNCKKFVLADLIGVALGDWEQSRATQMRAARALIRLGWASKGHGLWEKVSTSEQNPGKE